MAPAASTSSDKLSVPAFLKLLTTGGVGLSTSEALGCASALIKAGYNKANVANPFRGTSEPALVAAGVTDPDTRKQLVAWGRTGKARTKVEDVGDKRGRDGPSLLGNASKGKKRRRENDLDKPLPTKAEEKEVMSLDFEEEMEDYLLHDRSCVINRAPVMTAWATVVAERLGFSRQEALSIAHTYTNMNATSKGVSLGIYSPEKGKQRTTVGPSQPYVEIMGRKVPVLALQTGEWRGIANGAIAEPEQAFGYIQRSFRQNMSAAIGAFRLLAETIDPDELNKIGFNLYAEFRPEVNGWGEKGHLQLGKVLDLRRGPAGEVKKEEEEAVKEESGKPEDNKLDQSKVDHKPPDQQINIKKEENIESASIPPISDNETEDKSVTVPSGSLPPPKKARLETDFDDFDDGGIADDDLVGFL